MTTKRGFLFPVKALSKVFRGKFVDALKEARSTAKLRSDALLAEGPWRALLAKLFVHEWVVYAKQPLGGPVQVLEYLALYASGGDLKRAHLHRALRCQKLRKKRYGGRDRRGMIPN